MLQFIDKTPPYCFCSEADVGDLKGKSLLAKQGKP
jgi:hypothetical protein